MSKQQTRRSISTDAVTFWRAGQVARKLGESVAGAYSLALNEKADELQIPTPNKQWARNWVLGRRQQKGAA